MNAEKLLGLFLTLGALFLLGLATDLIGRKTRLPRVTLLLICGVAIGPSGLGLLPDMQAAWIDAVSIMAMVMVGFLLGEHLSLDLLRQHGAVVLAVSISVTVCTIVLVAIGLLALDIALPLALLLAAIATATDPAACSDVVHEARASGPFTTALLGIVAIDDVWGLLAFSLILTVLDALAGGVTGVEAWWHGLRDIGGAMLVGLGLGIPMALLTGRLRPGEPTQAEALGFVCLCAGLALWLKVSFLLAAIILGMTVANLALHHKYAFHEIEGIEWPFLILFFVLAGASLDLQVAGAASVVLFAYVGLRVLGRLVGGWLGGALVKAPKRQRRWFGPALLPQAGVAIGLAVVASQRFPQHAEELIAIAVSATVIFELAGPLLTRQALSRQGELPGDADLEH